MYLINIWLLVKEILCDRHQVTLELLSSCTLILPPAREQTKQKAKMQALDSKVCPVGLASESCPFFTRQRTHQTKSAPYLALRQTKTAPDKEHTLSCALDLGAGHTLKHMRHSNLPDGVYFMISLAE